MLRRLKRIGIILVVSIIAAFFALVVSDIISDSFPVIHLLIPGD